MTTVTASSAKLPRFRRSDLPSAPAAPVVPVRDAVPPSVPAPAFASAAGSLRVLEHPLAQQALTQLRNKHTAPAQYRDVSNQLLLLLAMEAIRVLPLREETVETSCGMHAGQTLARPTVFFALSRHGLGLAHGVANFLPGMPVGTVLLDRAADGHGVEPRLHLNSAPLLDTSHVILFEPVVASGASASVALQLLRRTGARNISLICFVGSLPGLSRLQSSIPDLQIWTAGIDTDLDPKRGPLPGIGDFAARLFA